MTDAVVEQIAEVLSRWNPLGDKAKTVSDLDGYRTEAEDIFLSHDLYQMGVQSSPTFKMY